MQSQGFGLFEQLEWQNDHVKEIVQNEAASQDWRRQRNTIEHALIILNLC